MLLKVISQLAFRPSAQSAYRSYYRCEYCLIIAKTDKEAETQEAALQDKPWSGHTFTQVMPHNIINKMICSICHITDELCSTL
jgi:hypothetical protein